MKKPYIQPETTVQELQLRNHLLQASVLVTEEETEYQW